MRKTNSRKLAAKSDIENKINEYKTMLNYCLNQANLTFAFIDQSVAGTSKGVDDKLRSDTYVAINKISEALNHIDAAYSLAQQLDVTEEDEDEEDKEKGRDGSSRGSSSRKNGYKDWANGSGNSNYSSWSNERGNSGKSNYSSWSNERGNSGGSNRGYNGGKGNDDGWER